MDKVNKNIQHNDQCQRKQRLESDIEISGREISTISKSGIEHDICPDDKSLTFQTSTCNDKEKNKMSTCKVSNALHSVQ